MGGLEEGGFGGKPHNDWSTGVAQKVTLFVLVVDAWTGMAWAGQLLKKVGGGERTTVGAGHGGGGDVALTVRVRQALRPPGSTTHASAT
jgi:hypothetical protein